MKKALFVAIPVALVAVLITAGTADSVGLRSHGRGSMLKDFLYFKIDRVSQELKLDPAQQTMVETFKKDLELMLEESLERRKGTRDLVREELRKDNPDANKISAQIHERIDDRARMAHQLTNRVNELFQNLTPDQKRIVSEMILERVAEREL